MKVEVMLEPGLYEEGFFPARRGDAGIDLRAANDVWLEPGDKLDVLTGVRLNMDKSGLVGLIFPRSGLGTKGIVLGNLVGVIDSGYQGELKLQLWNTSQKPAVVKRGDRVAQLVLFQAAVQSVVFEKVTEFTASTERGEQGYGSTGLQGLRT